MVKSINSSGSVRRLIYSNTVLNINRLDTLIFTISDAEINFRATFTFNFIDTGNQYDATGGVQNDGNIVYTLSKWDGIPEVETSRPLVLTTRSGHRLLLKFSTSSDVQTNRRTFKISLWAEVR